MRQIIFFGFFIFSVLAYSEQDVGISLQSGISREVDGSYNDANDLLASKMDSLTKSRLNMSYTNFGSGDIYYALYSDMQIRSFNLATKQYLGGWKLNSFDDAVRMAGEQVSAVPATIKEDMLVSASNDINFDEKKHDVACLNKYPLRFSDIDMNGEKEIIVLNAGNFIVFSASLNKVVFLAGLYFFDELTSPQLDILDLPLPENNNDHRFAASGFNNAYLSPANAVLPARRSFAKLYFNDFDADGAFDIVVWRKLYESRLNADPIKGFVKKGDLLVHYKLVNGEYKMQETNQATIKGWLTAKQLTWQKGYPNKSECPGQEGQLIPEMHDTLLNDPDVLR